MLDAQIWGIILIANSVWATERAPRFVFRNAFRHGSIMRSYFVHLSEGSRVDEIMLCGLLSEHPHLCLEIRSVIFGNYERNYGNSPFPLI